MGIAEGTHLHHPLLLISVIFDYDSDDLFYLQLDCEEEEQEQQDNEDSFYDHPSLTAAQRKPSLT